jgi:hypothetical protein
MRYDKKDDGEEGMFTDREEARACGWAFGVQNLALFSTDRIKEIIFKEITDDEGEITWKFVASRLEAEAMRYAEGDSMWGDMLEEIRDWKDRAQDGDSYTLGEWKKMAKDWGFVTSIQAGM